MGNNPTKEARTGSQSHPQPTGATAAASSSSRHNSTAQGAEQAAADTASNGRRRANSRHDLSLFRIGTHHDPDPADPLARRETRAERDARKREKERETRAVDRERSMKEENVDGGYLVTLGTYTGTEDFSKPVVRQLMIERRLAPFWKGLEDHEDSWTDNQLIAMARGEPLPAPGPTPTTGTVGRSSPTSNSLASSLFVPTSTNERPRSPSNPENTSTSLFGSPPSGSPFFRSRARTLVQMSTSRGNSSPDMTPTEISLPKDPNVNGQPLESFLYKHASECPICFLYYPPYLNRTRCCDQSICSECFVQIKRPDPHPPEHHDDPDNPHPQPPPESGSHDEYMLVSEAATCPFCKQPEFGITYDAPPFRRGLTYGDHHRLGSVMSAMSSSSSVNSQSPSSGNRRRTTSLGADSPNVITTDKVRPDWAKKLSDARAHALRRAAAATALHNAAYVLGGTQGELGPRITFGRRRRTLFGTDSPGGSGSADGLGFAHVGALLAAADRQGTGSSQSNDGSTDLFPTRGTSRRNRIEDLEELMMAEAIRLSLAAEEERSKREEKENAKNAKKEEKQKAKEMKKADKAAKRNGSNGGMYSAGLNSSSTSHFNGESSTSNPGLVMSGKGKAPASGSSSAYGFNSLNEPNSSISEETSTKNAAPTEDPQGFLEHSRAHIHSSPLAVPKSPTAPSHRQAMRHLSTASSTSSLADSNGDPSPNDSGLHIDNGPSPGPYSETPPSTESMFNFRSLAAVIGDEEEADEKPGTGMVEHVEHAAGLPPSPLKNSFGAGSGEGSSSPGMVTPPERPMSTGEKLFGSMPTSPILSVAREAKRTELGDGGVITPQASNPYDAKHYGDISVLDSAFGSAR